MVGFGVGCLGVYDTKGGHTDAVKNGHCVKKIICLGDCGLLVWVLWFRSDIDFSVQRALPAAD